MSAIHDNMFIHDRLSVTAMEYIYVCKVSISSITPSYLGGSKIYVCELLQDLRASNKYSKKEELN